jgi:hypothetical protein
MCRLGDDCARGYRGRVAAGEEVSLRGRVVLGIVAVNAVPLHRSPE